MLLKKDQKVEAETYDNNLLFYTILKTLLQCRLSEQKMISLQSLIKRSFLTLGKNPNRLKSFLLTSEQIIKTSTEARNAYENLINLLEEDKLQMWYDMVDIGVELLLFKDLILQESKAYSLARQQATETGIMDHLSLEYDAMKLCQPYGQRVLSSLLVFALTDSKRKKEYFLESSNQHVKQIYAKLNKVSNEYMVNCNNMLTLIVNESVNQSIVSVAGLDYEGRVEYMMKPLVMNWEGHSHDKNIKAMEYDFTFSFNKKIFGVSAKRTLRERYKQNHESVENLAVDYILVFTLGTDLTEDKLESLLQKKCTFVVTASEVYESKDYLKNNPNVISSNELTVSNDFLKRIIKKSYVIR